MSLPLPIVCIVVVVVLQILPCNLDKNQCRVHAQPQHWPGSDARLCCRTICLCFVDHVLPAWGPLPLSRTHTPRPHTPHTCLTNVGRAQSKSPSAISIAERCACLTLGDSADAALARTGRRECGVFIAEYAAFLPLCPPLLFGLQRAATTSLPRCLATSHLLLLSLLPSQLQRLQMIGFIIQVIQVRVLSQIACLAARREAPLAFSASYWWSNNRCACVFAVWHTRTSCAPRQARLRGPRFAKRSASQPPSNLEWRTRTRSFMRWLLLEPRCVVSRKHARSLVCVLALG